MSAIGEMWQDLSFFWVTCYGGFGLTKLFHGAKLTLYIYRERAREVASTKAAMFVNQLTG